MNTRPRSPREYQCRSILWPRLPVGALVGHCTIFSAAAQAFLCQQSFHPALTRRALVGGHAAGPWATVMALSGSPALPLLTGHNLPLVLAVTIGGLLGVLVGFVLYRKVAGGQ